MDSFIQRFSSRRWPITMQPQSSATKRLIDTTEVWSDVAAAIPSGATKSNTMPALPETEQITTECRRSRERQGQAGRFTSPTSPWQGLSSQMSKLGAWIGKKQAFLRENRRGERQKKKPAFFAETSRGVQATTRVRWKGREQGNSSGSRATSGSQSELRRPWGSRFPRLGHSLAFSSSPTFSGSQSWQYKGTHCTGAQRGTVSLRTCVLRFSGYKKRCLLY